MKTPRKTATRTKPRPSRGLLLDRDIERLKKQLALFDAVVSKGATATVLAEFDGTTERLIGAVFGEVADRLEAYEYARHGEAETLVNRPEDAQEDGALDVDRESVRQRRRVIEGCIWDLDARRAAKATSSRPAAKDGPQVSDYMSENVRSIHLDATLKEAGKLLQKYKIGLLFVDDDKRYVGVITESGLSRNAVARGLDPTTTLVKSCMARKIISIEDDEPIIEAVKLMKEHAIRHLAVTKDNTVIGIISVSDILRGYSGVE